MIDTTKLRELAQNATPGEWYVSAPAEHAVWKDIGDRRYLIADTSDGFTDDNNSEYIAAANPATVLALLDERDRANRMFLAACADLGAINAALGLDHDDAGADPILYEVKRMQLIEAAARNLAKVKGRHNSEIAMNQLLETLK
jgi:hypothetical protein